MKYFKAFFSWYFSKSSLPYWCLFFIDTLIVFLSGIFVFGILNRSVNVFNYHPDLFLTLSFYVAFSWIGAIIFKTYSSVVRFSSFVDLLNVAYANIVSIVLAISVSFLLEFLGLSHFENITVAEIVLTYMVATIGMAGVRVMVKSLYDDINFNNHAIRVLIYGAEAEGVGLAKSIRLQKPLQFYLCGFISHDNRAKHKTLMGQRVFNDEGDIIKRTIEERRISAVLIPSNKVDNFRDNQELQDLLLRECVKIFMARNAKEVSIAGNLKQESEPISDVSIREVSVEDLLPREEIAIDMDTVGEMLAGKNVMITGSAGSIGSELVRQIAIFKPANMVLIDQAETPQHDILLMLEKYPEIKTDVIVTSICHGKRMDKIFELYRPDFVFHAAAYKHVPMMEYNPSEAVLNNIHGTKVLADLSVKYGVSKFVMVSTDKAVNPTNVMGCSKRICEMYVQSLNNAQCTTQFVTTRFGNVLGSNGSVIPLFREQIRNGGPVTVTDERIVRYFMLIPEACKLVLEAGTKGNGGEIFVFDMGKPVRIIDLAKRMIALSGAKNVEIKITGLRPGEKLYEEVLNELEGTKPSFHKKIRIANVRQYDFEQISVIVDDLINVAKGYNNMLTVKKMKEIVPEYKSNNSLYEQLD